MCFKKYISMPGFSGRDSSKVASADMGAVDVPRTLSLSKNASRIRKYARMNVTGSRGKSSRSKLAFMESMNGSVLSKRAFSLALV
jgi:hypothetical protein